MGLMDLCGDIKKRTIVLYGREDEIKNFLNTYGELLNIDCVITDYKNETKLQLYAEWNIKTEMFQTVDLSDKLIVICDKIIFSSLQKRLEHVGKKEYVDYISCELVESMFFEKKIILSMGTQLLGQVSKFLECCEGITSRYSVIFYQEDEIMEPYMNRIQEYKHVARYCDVYILSSCEKERFYLKTLKKAVLSSHCKVIRVSDYGFNGYFPQTNPDRDVISDYLLRERERLEMSYETLAFSRTDYEMEKYCKDGVDIEKIIDILNAEDYFDEKFVITNFEKEVVRIKELEITDTIKLGDFIMKHKDECLCRNLNEWNEPVVSYVSNKILEILGMSEMTINYEKRMKIIEDNSGSEMLIYPSVQRALGLRDKMKDKKYKVTTYYNVKYMDATEYMEFKAVYLHKAMCFLRITGMDQTLDE